ncbi:MAG TPA: response regulator transcription factor [Dinghuibacter sp.]|uniref:response regulator transcription factor n=1 Tax=Dinghuibacter sp. TaxID=2024697 RepID=UPI002BA76F8E|nr:response regulator transcription factor [Dinghuibacter sp.]HTJ14329.1 response regulator transcription factor [Dinghuibacter sp.]
MNLLIIEDELELSRNIDSYLSQSMYTCETAGTYQAATAKLSLGRYDCIILDIGLPDGSGLELLRQLKQSKLSDGVLIISAKNSLNDKLEGLELGADDYLTKPFHLAELTARVNAIIRRRAFDGNNVIALGRLTIDLVSKSARTDTGELNLTRKEYELLLYFASNKNRVVTKESIVDHLWDASVQLADSYDFIYSHIKNLRRKLSDAGCPDLIRSVYGMGYKFSIG